MSDQHTPLGSPIQGSPGDILNWPMLKIRYKTSPDKIAALLPAGIEPGAEPNVTITIYNFPVNMEPEYGNVINVDANYQGIEGEYTLQVGINQEAPLFVCHEAWGQPKVPSDTDYFRLMDMVEAKCSHQGYTFLTFKGVATETLENGDDFEQNEWWIKVSRAVDMVPGNYDFGPHVVRVHSKYGTALRQKVEGQLELLPSPWDPVATMLPIEEYIGAELWTPIFKDRQITLAGPLDGDAFVPHLDVISGTRWPGENGGPKQA